MLTATYTNLQVVKSVLKTDRLKLISAIITMKQLEIFLLFSGWHVGTSIPPPPNIKCTTAYTQEEKLLTHIQQRPCPKFKPKQF